MELLRVDDSRVREIMGSQGVIEVLYGDSQIWIDQIKDNGMVLLHYISNNKKAEVPVSMLVETWKEFN